MNGPTASLARNTRGSRDEIAGFPTNALSRRLSPSVTPTSTVQTIPPSSTIGPWSDCIPRWRCTAKGATIINLAEGQNPDPEPRKNSRRCLEVNPTEDMELMRREIFGPILPVRAYSDRQEVADYINGHDRPLAIYPFIDNTNSATTTSPA